MKIVSFQKGQRRTKPYGYCLFNLEAMATACRILSTPDENLFSFRLPDGRGMVKAFEFMYPFVQDKRAWQRPPDVQYWEYWPIRQPTWLFAGAALSRPEYIRLWMKLPPEPAVEEIVRNNPIREPLLWLS